MVEKKGLGKAIGHAFLWFGIAIVLFPLYIALVATTHTFDVLIGSTPLWFGGEFLKNFTTVLTQGLKAAGGIPVWVMMANSLVMALGIAIGKIAISITAAYAIVYFRFPGRELCFVLIFITLMMPVEVRIVPTFQVAANLNFIDSYLGLVLPLIASATATFLYRQMFMTIRRNCLRPRASTGPGRGVSSWTWCCPFRARTPPRCSWCCSSTAGTSTSGPCSSPIRKACTPSSWASSAW